MPQQNTPYNQPQPKGGMPPQGMPMGPIMPPPPFMRKSKTWRERIMSRYGMGMHDTLQRDALTVPRWLVLRPILFFFIAFAACTYVFGYVMPIRLALVSGMSLVLFFYGCNVCSKHLKKTNEQIFIKNIFKIALIIRLIWVVYSYYVYNPDIYSKADGYGDDNSWYMDFAKNIVVWLKDGMPISFNNLRLLNSSAVDDVGYPIILAIEYLLTFETSDVFFPMLVKALVSAYCVKSIYYIAKRHYGPETARLAALFICFNPYMIFWCASMLKEAEMMFFCCLSVDNFDRTLSAGSKLTFRGLLPGILAGLLLFSFRTALGMVVFLAFFLHVVFVSHRIMDNGKKVLTGVLVGLILLVGMGDRLLTQTQQISETVQSDAQKGNMEWRSQRRGGNSFAKYASATVFAPLIFTIPFPTFNVANEEQIMQLELSGAYFIKNIMSFFVILVMLLLLASGEWRKHVFIVAYTCGYLLVLVLSSFAQGGRFHAPIWPMLMIFAAYGIQIARGNKRLQRGFNLALLLEILICLGWNWFKLKGRGMI